VRKSGVSLEKGPATAEAALNLLSDTYHKALRQPPAIGGGYRTLGEGLRLACRHLRQLGVGDPWAAVEGHAAGQLVLPDLAGVNAKYHHVGDPQAGPEAARREATKLRELQLQIVLHLELARLRPGTSGEGEAVSDLAVGVGVTGVLCGFLGAMPMLMDKHSAGNFATFLDEALAGLFWHDFPQTVEAVYEELEVDLPEQPETEPEAAAAAAGTTSSPGGSRVSHPFAEEEEEEEEAGAEESREEEDLELPDEGEPLCTSPLSLRGPDGGRGSGTGSTGAGRGISRHNSNASLNGGGGGGSRVAPLAGIPAAGLPRAGPPKKFIEKKKFKEVRSKVKKGAKGKPGVPAAAAEAEKKRHTSRGLFRDLAGRSHSRCSQSPVMTDFHVTETPMKAGGRRRGGRAARLDDDVIPESPPMKL